MSLHNTQVKCFFPPLFLEGREEGVGLTCFSFFFFTDHTENAVVLTSGLSVVLASNAVLF